MSDPAAGGVGGGARVRRVEQVCRSIVDLDLALRWIWLAAWWPGRGRGAELSPTAAVWMDSLAAESAGPRSGVPASYERLTRVQGTTGSGGRGQVAHPSRALSSAM